MRAWIWMFSAPSARLILASFPGSFGKQTVSWSIIALSMAHPFPAVPQRSHRRRGRQGTLVDMVTLSVFALVAGGLRMAQGVVGGRLGRVTAATACEEGPSGTILAPAGAKPLSSRTEVPLGRRIGAGERVSYGIPSEVPAPAPFSRRKGDFPRIPPPQDFVAGQQNPIDTHSSCERVSTWVRHRFVHECVSRYTYATYRPQSFPAQKTGPHFRRPANARGVGGGT